MHMKTVKELLETSFALLREAVQRLGINLIDNYAYREYTTREVLQDYLPSITKVVGRTGDDASAPGEDYFHIELKSGTKKNKVLTMNCFPSMDFDKQNDPARRQAIFQYDGLAVSFFEYYQPYPTVVIFVPKEHVPKLHPLFRQKQDIKVEDFARRQAEGKNIGRDTISVSVAEARDIIGEENFVCWLRGARVDSRELFRMLDNKEIKINQ